MDSRIYIRMPLRNIPFNSSITIEEDGSEWHLRYIKNYPKVDDTALIRLDFYLDQSEAILYHLRKIWHTEIKKLLLAYAKKIFYSKL